MPAEKLYLETGRTLKGAEEGQLFGKLCFKTNGKPFIAYFQECMVFKLNGKTHEEALALKGAVLFDPSGKKRPMKEWVQVPFEHKTKWKELAAAAMKYVKSISK